nr:Tetratricopeptide repeat protein 36 [Polyrhizophydium stewartii]
MPPRSGCSGPHREAPGAPRTTPFMAARQTLVGGLAPTSLMARPTDDQILDAIFAGARIDDRTLMQLKQLESDAVALAEQNDLAKALETLTRAVELCPTYASAYNNRAQVQRLLGNEAAAYDDLCKAIEHGSTTQSQQTLKQAYTQRAILRRKRGDEAGAEADFAKGAQYGNEIAKGMVKNNPYAKLTHSASPPADLQKMNEANRQRLRYSEISTKPGIDSTIEVSLLRRQLMLRKRNIERESLEQQMAILDKVKLSTPAIEEKIAAVELSKLAQHANNQFQKHRLAWREENARLQKWRAFLESDLRDGVASFFRAACDDPAAYVDAVRQIADQEVSDDSELDKERAGGYHARAKLSDARQYEQCFLTLSDWADIHAKLQALAGMLVAEKSAKRDLGEKAIAGLRARIDALKQELNSLVAEDDRRIARLEEDIAAATPTAHATSIEDLQLQDPWVQFDGSVQKLSAVESVDPILTARCRADVLR